MPEAPAAMPVLSTTRTSAPLPRPFALSASARWYALLRPCTPAPITTYFTPLGSAIRCPCFAPSALSPPALIADAPHWSSSRPYWSSREAHSNQFFASVRNWFALVRHILCCGRSGKVPEDGCETAADG